MKRKIIIGTRGSDLALWQANNILEKIKKIGIDAKINIIKTQGDIIQDLSFDKMEGKGFFTKEIEEKLLAGEIDMAVHSHKDVETTPADGTCIIAVTEREDPSDVLLIRNDCVDEKQRYSLKKQAIVGTSSARRKSQLLALRGDVQIKDLRGNVPTRIKKLIDGEYDAILIANAGMERLSIQKDEFVKIKLDPKEFVPAPAQGALAIQIRSNDSELSETLQKLNIKEIQAVVGVERKILNLFEGGCKLPLGAYCAKDEDDDGNTIYRTWVSVASEWNKAPKYYYHESAQTEGIAEKIVSKLKRTHKGSVFITKDIKPYHLLYKSLTDNGFSITGRTLIETRRVNIRQVPKTEWIFFSSKNAVKYFFEQNPDVEGVKYGAVGKGTSEELRRFGKKAEFIGYSNDTKLTGKQFEAAVKDGKVLFPQAKGSMRSIQHQFKNRSQVFDLIVYETIKSNKEPISDVDILIFTSPSNVDAFFETNNIHPHQKIVAIGEATGNTLKKYDIHSYYLPRTFDDIGFAQSVYKIEL